MWLICEATSDPGVLATLFVADEDAWVKAETAAVGPSVVRLPPEQVESQWAHVKWIVRLAPTSAREGAGGWRVHAVERLSEFVWPRDTNMSEADWLDGLATKSVEVTGTHDCPAYCRWPGRPDTYLGPLRFPATSGGGGRGPSEEGMAAIVTVPIKDLTEVEWGGATRSILRPGRVVTEVDYHVVSPISDVAGDVARLLREWSTEDPLRDVGPALGILAEFSQQLREPRSTLERAKVSTVLKAIDRVAADDRAIERLAAALLGHRDVQARVAARLHEFQQDREREIEAQVWSRLQEREEELDRELDGKREELAAHDATLQQVKAEITRIRDEARVVQDELIEATRRSITNLRDHGVSALSDTLMVDSLLRAHSATPPVPASSEGSRLPKDVHELLYRGSSACEDETQRRVVRLGVAAALNRRIVVLRGVNAEGWGDFFARMLGGGNAWRVWCRADVFAPEDLLKSPALRMRDGISARLGRALAQKSMLNALPAVHLMGLGNAPWATGGSALLRSFAQAQPISWTPAADRPVESFVPAKATVLVSLVPGELHFPLDRSLAGLVAVWHPDVEAPQDGPDFDLTGDFIAEALATLAGSAADEWDHELDGLERRWQVEARTWLSALAAGAGDVDVAHLLATWAASRGGILGRPIPGLSDRATDEMQTIVDSVPGEAA